MENNNSVCFVARINEISPIPNADNIELAKVGGWNCIVKKNSHKVDDLVVCATTDAVIPISLSDNLNVTNYLRKGGRVRTIKLKGVYSECLIIPFEYVSISSKKPVSEGSDCMDILGIFKYEPPTKEIQLASGKKIRYSENPNFPIYYKFPNIKNVPGIFTEDDIVEITRKIHGTNARYGIVRKNKINVFDRLKKFFGNKWAYYEFVVGSHNVEKGSDSQGFYDTNVWYEINDKYKIKEKLWEFIKEADSVRRSYILNGVVIYGEIYGKGIQKNYDYGLDHIDIKFFDVMVDNTYEPPDAAYVFFRNIVELPYVDILYKGPWSQEIQDTLTFNQYVEPAVKIDKKYLTPHEGIVIKHKSGEREKIAKVINPDYLIYAENKDVGDSH